jgi:hypothetical protein
MFVRLQEFLVAKRHSVPATRNVLPRLRVRLPGRDDDGAHGDQPKEQTRDKRDAEAEGAVRERWKSPASGCRAWGGYPREILIHR